MSAPNYKDNLLELVGGQCQFDFVVIKYCENIQDDHVNVFFADLDLNQLMAMQKEFLNAALLDQSQEDTAAAMGRLAVQYQTLWQRGLNDQHFDTLKAHFIEALRDCWVQEKLVAIFDAHYETLRPLFQQGNNKEQSNTTAYSVPISIAQRNIHSRLGGVNASRRI